MQGKSWGQARGPEILVLHIIYSLIFHVVTFPIYFSTNNKEKKYFRKYITKDGYNKTFLLSERKLITEISVSRCPTVSQLNSMAVMTLLLQNDLDIIGI